MMILEKISIIIPTFNERENIPTLVRRITDALKDNFEILIVDDSSPDGTAKAVNELSEKTPNLRLLTRRSKRGLASAVIEGFGCTSGSILAVMDGDLQHPPEKLDDMAANIRNGAEIVIASRYIEGGGTFGWSMNRKIISKIASFPARAIFPRIKEVSDPLSGFFMLRRNVIRKANLNPIGFKILLEILVKGSYRTIVEVPYTFEKRKKGRTKFNALQILEYARHLIRLMMS